MDAELRRTIWPIFLGEATENLREIGAAILALETASEVGRAELVRGACRLAHSLKGSAASLGLEEFAGLAHALEDALLSAGIAPGASIIEAALRATEALEAALGRGGRDGDDRIPGLPELVAALGGAAATPTREEPAAELWPLFREEAREQLARLSALLAPDADRSGAEAARLAGVLAGAAATLKLEELEVVAAAAAQLLRVAGEGPLEPAAVALLREACAGIEAAFGELDAGRRALVPEAVRLAAALRAAAAAGGLGSAPGAGSPGAAPAAVAGALPEQAAAPESSPRPRASSTEPAEPRSGASGTVRVSTAALDSLALQLEELAHARVRQERRARELKALGAAVATANLGLRHAAGELRQREGTQATALDATARELRGLQLQLASLGTAMRRDAEQLALVGAVVRQDLRELRTIPASVALEPLRRTVRELAGRLGKRVRLTLSGLDVRLDRRIVDELKDPLVHLVRNSLDHGIEPAAVRERQGKPPEGHLQVTVEQRGNRIRLELADDGNGLDLGRVRELAVARGLVKKEELLAFSEQEVARLIFRPGFSTAERITEISGRGVGLDVVQSTATRLGGSADVSSIAGKGSRFVLDLPLTIAAVGAILVRTGGILVALPAEAVEHLLRVGRADLVTVAGRPTCKVGEARVPVATLAQVLDLPRGRQLPDGTEAHQALLLSSGGQRRVLLVEQVVGLQELIVQSLGRQLPRAIHLSGAAILDDGTVVPVLEASRLLEQPGERAAAASGAARVRIVVADDSLTTRSAMKAVLELAGFEVIPAVDGVDALRLCEEHHPALVVSDVQMPNLDGLGLTRSLRADPALAATPVILVTSLDSAQDRAAGLAAGADGYLVKRDVERGKLLELVQGLAPGRP